MRHAGPLLVRSAYRYGLGTLLVLALAWPQAVHAQGEKQPPAADRRGTADSPLIVKEDSAERERETRERDEDRRERTAADDAVIRYTRGLFFVTGILALVTAGLWWATQRLVRDAEKNAERQLRAYLFLDPAKQLTIVRNPSTSDTLEVEIHVKNFGATPAYSVQGISWVDFGVWPIPDNFEFIGPAATTPSTKAIIPPGGMIHYRTGTARAMTAQEISDFGNGAKCVYVYGSISYRDAFDSDRLTNFCVAYQAPADLNYTGMLPQCDRHNEAT